MSATSEESLAHLLGGRRGALDATLPPVAFVAGYVAARESIGVGVAAALGTALVVAVWRIRRGTKPRAVAIGVLGVGLAALIALRTGRAQDFFVLRIATNAASAAAWLASIAVRWPLLGVVVGLVLGQKARWRKDPALLKAYGRGSWIWVLQYTIRVAVMVPLYLAGDTIALGVVQAALTWPLVALSLVVSWWVVRRSLPEDHPGLRHPREAT